VAVSLYKSIGLLWVVSIIAVWRRQNWIILSEIYQFITSKKSEINEGFGGLKLEGSTTGSEQAKNY
jgi:hypothetical protein